MVICFWLGGVAYRLYPLLTVKFAYIKILASFRCKWGKCMVGLKKSLKNDCSVFFDKDGLRHDLILLFRLGVLVCELWVFNYCF